MSKITCTIVRFCAALTSVTFACCDSGNNPVGISTPKAVTKKPISTNAKTVERKAQEKIAHSTELRKRIQAANREHKGHSLLLKLQELYIEFIDSHSLEESLDLLLNADVNAARNGGFERLFLLIAEKNPDLGVSWITKHGKDLFEPALASQFGRILMGLYPNEAKIYLAKLSSVSRGALGIRSGILQVSAEHYHTKTGAAYNELFPLLNVAGGDVSLSDDISAIISGLQNSPDARAFKEALKFTQLIKDPEKRSLEEFQLLGPWAEKDGSEAAKYATTVMDEKLRKSGFQEVFSRWARQNPKEAGLALLEIPLQSDRLAALNGYLPVLSELSPEESTEFKAAALRLKR